MEAAGGKRGSSCVATGQTLRSSARLTTGGITDAGRARWMMAKKPPVDDPLSAEEKMILFALAAAIEPAAVGITGPRMKRMFIRGLIDRERAGRYTLTDAGRAALAAILKDAGFKHTDDRRARLLADALDGHTEAVTLYLRTLSLEPMARLNASVVLYLPGYDEVPGVTGGDPMVWIIGAICMILFGIALVAIGLSVNMLGYAILGGILILAGIFILVSMRRSLQNMAPFRRR
jgi:hypothetical protein